MQPPDSAPFVVVASLGQGGIGDVFEVQLPGDPRRLAAKILRRADPNTVARFQREGEVAARLRHPNIVPVHASGTLPDGTPYLLLDMIDGETLAARLERGPLPVEEVVRIGSALGEALVHAHAQGVVHRDVKPGNILLDWHGVPRLTDFGIARAIDLEALTRTGHVVGTPAYMAPEQVDSKQSVGPPADIYALGAVLYEALAGRPALELESGAGMFARILSSTPDPVAKHRQDVPRALSQLLARCLSKDPAARPDAGELVAGLQDLTPDVPAPRGGLGLLLFAVLCGVGAAALALHLLVAPAPAPTASATPTPTPARTPSATPTGPERHDLTMPYAVGDAIRIALLVQRDSPHERSKLQVRLAGRVREVGDPSVVLLGRIEAIKVEIVLRDETRIAFDSGKSDAQNMPTLRALRGLVGVEARFDIDKATGRYTLKRYAEQVEPVLGRLPALFDALKLTLSARLVENGINVVRCVYPGRPVAVGEEWVVPVQVNFNGQFGSGKRRCALERDPAGALRVRTIGLEPGFQAPPGMSKLSLEGETQRKAGWDESRAELSVFIKGARYRTRWSWNEQRE